MINKNGTTRIIQSPFRYPGGKSFLYEYLRNEIKKTGITSPQYGEPYAGGAGAAIRLLSAGIVSRIRINDADARIYSAWHSMVKENERFLNELTRVKVDMKSWRKYAEIVAYPKTATSIFDLGFATFFLNRTNRSGIILRAGPIGGYKQAGEWKLDARFNKKELVRRISWLGDNEDKITLSNLDGLSYLKRASKNQYNDKTLFFVDPPYVGAGGKLYLNLMTEKKHRQLAVFLQTGIIPHWIVTYDDCPLISDIYKQSSVHDLEVVYSLQNKRRQNELLIKPFAIAV